MDLLRVIAVWALTVNLTSCGLGSNLNPPIQADDLGAIGDGFGRQGTLIGNGGSNPTTSFGFLPSGDFYCYFNQPNHQVVSLEVVGWIEQSDRYELIAEQFASFGETLIVPAAELLGFDSVICRARLPASGGQVVAEPMNCSRADLNSDGSVNSMDLSLLLGQINEDSSIPYDAQFDINKDGVVSAQDMTHLLQCMESGGAQ
jgi:hypothetical protein